MLPKGPQLLVEIQAPAHFSNISTAGFGSLVDTTTNLLGDTT